MHFIWYQNLHSVEGEEDPSEIYKYKYLFQSVMILFANDHSLYANIKFNNHIQRMPATFFFIVILLNRKTRTEILITKCLKI